MSFCPTGQVLESDPTAELRGDVPLPSAVLAGEQGGWDSISLPGLSQHWIPACFLGAPL